MVGSLTRAALAVSLIVGVAAMFLGNPAQRAGGPEGRPAATPLAMGVPAVSPTSPRLDITAGLVLTGVVSQPTASLAIILREGASERVYRVGQEIRSGVILAEVLPNGAILARGEQRQRLAFVRQATPQRLQRLQPPSSATAPTADVPDRSSPSGVGLKWSRQSSIVANSTSGLQLKEVTPDSLYAGIGLVAGDVLRSVNGAALHSPRQLKLLDRQLKSGGRGYLEVQREGQPMMLRFGPGKGQ